MQQFTVPQFIDVESKIIGPVTTRQFLIILGAALIIGVCYRLFDFSLFIFITVVVVVIASLFAFVKINSRPFHLFVLNLLQTLRRARLRIWNNNKEEYDLRMDEMIDVKAEQNFVPKEYYKKSHLAEVALIVDTKGKYKGE